MAVNFQPTVAEPSDTHAAMIAGAAPATANPKPYSGSWKYSPFEIQYTVSFATEYFDADFYILGMKLGSITFNPGGPTNDTATIKLLDWVVDVTIDANFADNVITASVTIQQGGVTDFQRQFTLAIW